MRYPAINDVHRVDSAFCRIERTGDLGQHAARDRSVRKQFINAAGCEVGQQLTGLVENPTDVREHHQLFCFQDGGQSSRHHVRIDVVALIGRTETNGANHRNKGIILQGFDHTLVVTAAGTNLLGRVSAQIDSPAFVVITEPVISNKYARVIVITHPPLPEGLTRATLKISTGNPRQPSLTTVVSAFVPGAFAVMPPELLLVGREGELVRRELSLRSESNTAFRVLAVEPPLKDIACTIVATNAALCRIEFPSLPVLRSLEGKQVRIVTDLPSRPEILVPIRVFIR